MLLVGREPGPPLQPPATLEGLPAGKEPREDVLFRPDEWWGEQDIELMTRTSVMNWTCASAYGDARTRRRDRVGALLATGANVRRLRLEGCELDGIHYLRAFANSRPSVPRPSRPSARC